MTTAVAGPFLIRKAEVPVEESLRGTYNEAREVTLLAGRPLVQVDDSRLRTSTRTNATGEGADPDPSDGPDDWLSALRTQTMTKAGGEPPDADRPEEHDAPEHLPTDPASGTYYSEDRDLTLDLRGTPLARTRSSLLRTQTSTRIRGEAADPD